MRLPKEKYQQVRVGTPEFGEMLANFNGNRDGLGIQYSDEILIIVRYHQH